MQRSKTIVTFIEEENLSIRRNGNTKRGFYSMPTGTESFNLQPSHSFHRFPKSKVITL